MLLSEPKRVKIGMAGDFLAGSHKTIHVGDLKVTVYNVDGAFYAIDDRCPHRGASLAKGTRAGVSVSCPLHKWDFDLQTGSCQQDAGITLRRFEVLRDGDALLVDLADGDDQEHRAWQGDHRYLLRYGAMGWVGHFSSVEAITCDRGDFVVVQTHRGSEVAEVLVGAAERMGLAAAGSSADESANSLAGEVLRSCTRQDHTQLESVQRSDTAGVFEQCQKLLADAELPIQVVDCERLFDGRTTILYFLGEDSNWLQPIAETLEENVEGEIQFSPVHEPVASPGGCGSGGCGSGGCGSGQEQPEASGRCDS